jgi:hypothetical protein
LGLGLLIYVQVLVTWRTKRILNVGLVLASGMLLGMVGWTAGQFWFEQSATPTAMSIRMTHVWAPSARMMPALRSLRDQPRRADLRHASASAPCARVMCGLGRPLDPHP